MSVTAFVCLEYVHACMSRSTCSRVFFLSRLAVKSRSRSNLELFPLCSLPMGGSAAIITSCYRRESCERVLNRHGLSHIVLSQHPRFYFISFIYLIVSDLS